MQMQLILTPEQLQEAAKEKPAENIFFRKFLRQKPSKEVDEIVHKLNKEIAPLIDCTQCGNCCKKLEPALSEEELLRLSSAKNTDPVLFREEYVGYDGHTLYLRAKPCMFLNECKCTVYEKRPESCAAYPHLDQDNMKYRHSFWENYHVCPIVFNVIEQLKTALNFKT